MTVNQNLPKFFVMFSMKACRTCRELVRELRRSISKTSTDKNSDAICRAQDHKLQLNTLEDRCEKNINYRRWMKQMQHNNIRWEICAITFRTRSFFLVSCLQTNKQENRCRQCRPLRAGLVHVSPKIGQISWKTLGVDDTKLGGDVAKRTTSTTYVEEIT